MKGGQRLAWSAARSVQGMTEPSSHHDLLLLGSICCRSMADARGSTTSHRDKSGLGAFLFFEFIHCIHLGPTRWHWKFVHAMVCLWSNYWKAARRLMKMGIKQEKIELDLSTSFKTALCNCNVEKIDFLKWTIEYLFRFPSNLGGWEDKLKHLNPE